MIPASLAQWTLETVTSLLEKGVHETDQFDFKERLPHSRDEKGKERLSDTCAAFANSQGGFLIFGLADNRTLALEDRLKGIEKSVDFPEHFGVYPQRCAPTVAWEFRNPALELSSGRVIHVVHIPQSPLAPHSTGVGNALKFPKRTNKGTEFMDYSQVQAVFVGFYEKRLKLQMLRAELAQIIADASALIIEETENDGSEYALPTIELRVLESVLADTYSITHRSPGFLESMNALRSIARTVNNKIATFRMQVALPMSNKAEIVKDHNRFIRQPCVRVIHLAQQGTQQLDVLLRTS